jgi:hypothetical protein
VFDQVRNAVDALRATARGFDPLCVEGRDAAELLAVVTEGERVCAAMKALLARRVEETKVWREGGHRSAAHWVAEATGETVGWKVVRSDGELDLVPPDDPDPP